MQLIVGVCVLGASALAHFVHPGFLGLTAFFGAGLTVAGMTGVCGLAKVVGRTPWNR